MLLTRYHLVHSEYDAILQCETESVLQATKLFVENVTKTNPARRELLEQILLMEQSIRDAEDCDITEGKHGYLRSVFLTLFDAGDGQIICVGQIYSNKMVEKENWKVDGPPVFSLGGHGGIQYRTPDGRIVFKQGTWIS